MTVTVSLPDADATRALGERLAGLLRAGDVVLLSGDLGAGKTTLTQGIGVGLGVRGQVASPTFIIARVHAGVGAGPDLVHVDAYRLTSLAEVDALDLDASLEESVTVVEWGTGKVETLAAERLEVDLRRPRGLADGAGTTDADGGPADLSAGPREAAITGIGARWAGVDAELRDGA